MPRTTDLPKAAIVAAYENGTTVQELADKYGRSFGTMRENLHRWGAALRRTGPKRTHMLDETFFDNITTERQAYWLGFLLADGSVTIGGTGGAVVRLNLAARDRGHVAKFAGDLGSTAAVREAHGGKSAYVLLCSRTLCAALGRYECVPNKTAGHGTPKLRADLYRHMYRGATDGDGSFGRSAGGLWYSLVGSPAFVWDYQTWLMRNVGVEETKLAVRGPVLSLKYAGTTQVRKILDALYADAAVSLDRKQQRYADLTAQ